MARRERLVGVTPAAARSDRKCCRRGRRYFGAYHVAAGGGESDIGIAGALRRAASMADDVRAATSGKYARCLKRLALAIGMK